jgi:hypothetical protein
MMSVFDSQFITFFMNLYSYHFADSGFSGYYLKLFFDFAKEKLFNSILIYSIQSLASYLELFSRSLLLFLFLEFLDTILPHTFQTLPGKPEVKATLSKLKI